MKRSWVRFCEHIIQNDWNPEAVGEQTAPKKGYTRFGSVPVIRCRTGRKGTRCLRLDKSGKWTECERRTRSLSPIKLDLPEDRRGQTGLKRDCPDDSTLVPADCETHILDHMRCTCAACMDFACRWRRALKQKFRSGANPVKGFKPKLRRWTYKIGGQNCPFPQLYKDNACSDEGSGDTARKWPYVGSPKVNWWFGNYVPPSDSSDDFGTVCSGSSDDWTPEDGDSGNNSLDHVIYPSGAHRNHVYNSRGNVVSEQSSRPGSGQKADGGPLRVSDLAPQGVKAPPSKSADTGSAQNQDSPLFWCNTTGTGRRTCARYAGRDPNGTTKEQEKAVSCKARRGRNMRRSIYLSQTKDAFENVAMEGTMSNEALEDHFRSVTCTNPASRSMSAGVFLDCGGREVQRRKSKKNRRLQREELLLKNEECLKAGAAFTSCCEENEKKNESSLPSKEKPLEEICQDKESLDNGGDVDRSENHRNKDGMDSSGRTPQRVKVWRPRKTPKRIMEEGKYISKDLRRNIESILRREHHGEERTSGREVTETEPLGKGTGANGKKKSKKIKRISGTLEKQSVDEDPVSRRWSCETISETTKFLKKYNVDPADLPIGCSLQKDSRGFYQVFSEPRADVPKNQLPHRKFGGYKSNFLKHMGWDSNGEDGYCGDTDSDEEEKPPPRLEMLTKKQQATTSNNDEKVDERSRRYETINIPSYDDVTEAYPKEFNSLDAFSAVPIKHGVMEKSEKCRKIAGVESQCRSGRVAFKCKSRHNEAQEKANLEKQKNKTCDDQEKTKLEDKSDISTNNSPSVSPHRDRCKFLAGLVRTNKDYRHDESGGYNGATDERNHDRLGNVDKGYCLKQKESISEDQKFFSPSQLYLRAGSPPPSSPDTSRRDPTKDKSGRRHIGFSVSSSKLDKDRVLWSPWEDDRSPSKVIREGERQRSISPARQSKSRDAKRRIAQEKSGSEYSDDEEFRTCMTSLGDVDHDYVFSSPWTNSLDRWIRERRAIWNKTKALMQEESSCRYDNLIPSGGEYVSPAKRGQVFKDAAAHSPHGIGVSQGRADENSLQRNVGSETHMSDSVYHSTMHEVKEIKGSGGVCCSKLEKNEEHLDETENCRQAYDSKSKNGNHAHLLEASWSRGPNRKARGADALNSTIGSSHSPNKGLQSNRSLPKMGQGSRSVDGDLESNHSLDRESASQASINNTFPMNRFLNKEFHSNHSAHRKSHSNRSLGNRPVSNRSLGPKTDSHVTFGQVSQSNRSPGKKSQSNRSAESHSPSNRSFGGDLQRNRSLDKKAQTQSNRSLDRKTLSARSVDRTFQSDRSLDRKAQSGRSLSKLKESQLSANKTISRQSRMSKFDRVRKHQPHSEVSIRGGRTASDISESSLNDDSDEDRPLETINIHGPLGEDRKRRPLVEINIFGPLDADVGRHGQVQPGRIQSTSSRATQKQPNVDEFEGTNSIETIKSMGSVKTNGSAKNSGSAKNNGSVKSMASLKSAGTVTSMGSVKSAGSVKATESVKSTGSLKATESVKSTDIAKSITSQATQKYYMTPSASEETMRPPQECQQACENSCHMKCADCCLELCRKRNYNPEDSESSTNGTYRLCGNCDDLDESANHPLNPTPRNSFTCCDDTSGEQRLKNDSCDDICNATFDICDESTTPLSLQTNKEQCLSENSTALIGNKSAEDKVGVDSHRVSTIKNDNTPPWFGQAEQFYDHSHRNVDQLSRRTGTENPVSRCITAHLQRAVDSDAERTNVIERPYITSEQNKHHEETLGFQISKAERYPSIILPASNGATGVSISALKHAPRAYTNAGSCKKISWDDQQSTKKNIPKITVRLPDTKKVVEATRRSRSLSESRGNYKAKSKIRSSCYPFFYVESEKTSKKNTITAASTKNDNAVYKKPPISRKDVKPKTFGQNIHRRTPGRVSKYPETIWHKYVRAERENQNCSNRIASAKERLQPESEESRERSDLSREAGEKKHKETPPKKTRQRKEKQSSPNKVDTIKEPLPTSGVIPKETSTMPIKMRRLSKERVSPKKKGKISTDNDTKSKVIKYQKSRPRSKTPDPTTNMNEANFEGWALCKASYRDGSNNWTGSEPDADSEGRGSSRNRIWRHSSLERLRPVAGRRVHYGDEMVSSRPTAKMVDEPVQERDALQSRHKTWPRPGGDCSHSDDESARGYSRSQRRPSDLRQRKSSTRNEIREEQDYGVDDCGTLQRQHDEGRRHSRRRRYQHRSSRRRKQCWRRSGSRRRSGSSTKSTSSSSSLETASQFRVIPASATTLHAPKRKVRPTTRGPHHKEPPPFLSQTTKLPCEDGLPAKPPPFSRNDQFTGECLPFGEETAPRPHGHSRKNRGGSVTAPERDNSYPYLEDSTRYLPHNDTIVPPRHQPHYDTAASPRRPSLDASSSSEDEHRWRRHHHHHRGQGRQRTVFRASDRVLCETPPSNEPGWQDRHVSLMGDCSEEKMENSWRRVQRLEARAKNLAGSVSQLKLNFGDIETRLDKVRTIQRDYLTKAERAVHMVQTRERSSRRRSGNRSRNNARDMLNCHNDRDERTIKEPCSEADIDHEIVSEGGKTGKRGNPSKLQSAIAYGEIQRADLSKVIPARDGSRHGQATERCHEENVDLINMDSEFHGRNRKHHRKIKSREELFAGAEDSSANNSNNEVPTWSRILAGYETRASGKSSSYCEDSFSDGLWSDDSEDEVKQSSGERQTHLFSKSQNFKHCVQRERDTEQFDLKDEQCIATAENSWHTLGTQFQDRASKLEINPRRESGYVSDATMHNFAIEDSDLYIEALRKVLRNFVARKPRKTNWHSRNKYINTSKSLSRVYARPKQPFPGQCKGSGKAISGIPILVRKPSNICKDSACKTKQTYNGSVSVDLPQRNYPYSNFHSHLQWRPTTSQSRLVSLKRSVTKKPTTYSQLYRNKLRQRRSQSRPRPCNMPRRPNIVLYDNQNTEAGAIKDDSHFSANSSRRFSPVNEVRNATVPGLNDYGEAHFDPRDNHFKTTKQQQSQEEHLYLRPGSVLSTSSLSSPLFHTYSSGNGSNRMPRRQRPSQPLSTVQHQKELNPVSSHSSERLKQEVYISIPPQPQNGRRESPKHSSSHQKYEHKHIAVCPSQQQISTAQCEPFLRTDGASLLRGPVAYLSARSPPRFVSDHQHSRAGPKEGSVYSSQVSDTGSIYQFRREDYSSTQDVDTNVSHTIDGVSQSDYCFLSPPPPPSSPLDFHNHGQDKDFSDMSYRGADEQMRNSNLLASAREDVSATKDNPYNNIVVQSMPTEKWKDDLNNFHWTLGYNENRPKYTSEQDDDWVSDSNKILRSRSSETHAATGRGHGIAHTEPCLFPKTCREEAIRGVDYLNSELADNDPSRMFLTHSFQGTLQNPRHLPPPHDYGALGGLGHPKPSESTQSLVSRQNYMNIYSNSADLHQTYKAHKTCVIKMRDEDAQGTTRGKCKDEVVCKGGPVYGRSGSKNINSGSLLHRQKEKRAHSYQKHLHLLLGEDYRALQQQQRDSTKTFSECTLNDRHIPCMPVNNFLKSVNTKDMDIQTKTGVCPSSYDQDFRDKNNHTFSKEILAYMTSCENSLAPVTKNNFKLKGQTSYAFLTNKQPTGEKLAQNRPAKKQHTLDEELASESDSNPIKESNDGGLAGSTQRVRFAEPIAHTRELLEYVSHYTAGKWKKVARNAKNRNDRPNEKLKVSEEADSWENTRRVLRILSARCHDSDVESSARSNSGSLKTRRPMSAGHASVLSRRHGQTDLTRLVNLPPSPDGSLREQRMPRSGVTRWRSDDSGCETGGDFDTDSSHF